MQIIAQWVTRVLQRLQERDAHAAEVNFVVFVHQQPVAAGEVELDGIQVRGPQVVVLKALQAHEHARFVFAKLERAGAVGRPYPVPARFNIAAVYNERGRVGEFRQ